MRRRSKVKLVRSTNSIFFVFPTFLDQTRGEKPFYLQSIYPDSLGRFVAGLVEGCFIQQEGVSLSILSHPHSRSGSLWLCPAAHVCFLSTSRRRVDCVTTPLYNKHAITVQWHWKGYYCFCSGRMLNQNNKTRVGRRTKRSRTSGTITLQNMSWLWF